uniref:Protein kinase domain-containing protein n=1 Tax=Oryza punctata TaxID=4537 RepID=A0A0E0M093_ORYPU
MALLLFFAAFLLAAATDPVVGQQPGFLSIDCGLEANYSGYKDTDLGIVYISDGPYVDGGEIHRVSAEFVDQKYRPYTTLRSFPSGVRNCYTLPTVAGAKYLVRVVSTYGNYDGKNGSSTLQFDLYLGVNRWTTVQPYDDSMYEALFVAWASWAPVCLVNTGQGTPFASAVELRQLGGELYPAVMANQSMAMYYRGTMGSTKTRVQIYLIFSSTYNRFPADQYDRLWTPMPNNPTWMNLNTTSNIQQEASSEVPLAILQNAITAAGNGTMLNITWKDSTLNEFMVFLYLADFQNTKPRQFDVYFNSDKPLPYSPRYLVSTTVYSSDWYRATDGGLNITLVATAKSQLPPMLNAFEVYTPIIQDTPTTFSNDCKFMLSLYHVVDCLDAIMGIKLEYGIKKNWMGDPCFPAQFKWEGVNCSNTSDNVPRIISIDLSNSNLHGVISSNFTLLTALKYLYATNSMDQSQTPFAKEMQGHSFSGYVHVFLKKQSSSLSCFNSSSPADSAYNPPRVPHPKNAPGNEKYHFDHLKQNENRQFTYEELDKFTGNFQRLIGQGGFGRVYHGCLEDNTEVAIKMLSGTTSQGLNGFLAEVESLTKVHHKNLVSLVGYCSEKAHLALVYEYMSRGNLFDHLRGLDYLHKGCNRPIIHRDVKTSNILLGQSLRAKIADFGLSKTYLTDTQSHMSATIAGSMGYIDPEYYQTGWITESSDVYSFGVVLLEVATGELPILQGHGHIVQRVKQNVALGDIRSIADKRLGENYDANSMWKVVEIALMCTESVASRRPSMAIVVAQLKESLALEEAHEDVGLHANPAGDAAAMLSTFGPTAR